MLITSIAIKKGVLAVLLVNEGVVVDTFVRRVPEEYASSTFRALLFGIKTAFMRVRNYISENNTSAEIVFEINNSTVKGWMDVCYSRKEYREQFDEVLHLLHELPIKYCFVCSAKPIALAKATESNITSSMKLSGLDTIMED